MVFNRLKVWNADKVTGAIARNKRLLKGRSGARLILAWVAICLFFFSETARSHALFFDARRSSDSLQTQYDLARSLERSGNARAALDVYANAYSGARTAVGSGMANGMRTDQFMAGFIEIACRYAWLLLDIGENEKGQRVISSLNGIIKPYEVANTPRTLLSAYGNLENLRSRISDDDKRLDEAEAHMRRALQLFSRVRALKTDDFNVDAAAAAVFGNWVAFYATASEKEDLNNKVCTIADEMMAVRAGDARAVSVTAQCLRLQGRILMLDKHNVSAAKQKFGAARDAIAKGLQSDPENCGLLLLMTDAENTLADILAPDKEATLVNQHRHAAKDYFVRATRGKTTFENNTLQVKNAYSALKRLDFSDRDGELAYFVDLGKAVEKNVSAFPKSPSFLYVAADTSARIASLTVETRRAEFTEMASTLAINLFDKLGTGHELSKYSEDVETYCGAYNSRIKARGEAGKLAIMSADVKAMMAACEPILKKFPWEFYLRQNLVGSRALAGKLQLDAKDYTRARENLEYASHWGRDDSSELLAKIYREGLGVPPQPQKASELDELAGKQKTLYFMIPADFNGIKSNVKIYAIEWPSDYPFDGVDDQVTWYKEARGGVISSDVVESFRKLAKIARENNTSFPALCKYALGNKK